MRTFCFIKMIIGFSIAIISLILFIYSLIKKPCKASRYALFFYIGNLIFQISVLILKHIVIK